jgi:hypothetical protein
MKQEQLPKNNIISCFSDLRYSYGSRILFNYLLLKNQIISSNDLMLIVFKSKFANSSFTELLSLCESLMLSLLNYISRELIVSLESQFIIFFIAQCFVHLLSFLLFKNSDTAKYLPVWHCCANYSRV